MTVTALTGPGRIVQFLWGTNQQNTFTFGYPLAVDEPTFWREPRTGSETAIINSVQDAWIQGSPTFGDYYARVKVRWIPLASWSGPGGFQAFLDWCTAGNSFTFIPDAVNAPLFGLPGCLLEEPFDSPQITIEPDGSQQTTLSFRNPTYDLGLAWR